jgi:hypothetical protein
VRATDDAMGRSRILDTLSAKGLEVDERRLVVLSADVSRDRLGLTPAVYDNLVESVRLVIHVSALILYYLTSRQLGQYILPPISYRSKIRLEVSRDSRSNADQCRSQKSYQLCPADTSA